MYGSRVVVPARLRQEVLHELYSSHQGQDRTLRRARQVVHWPSITNDIRNVVRSCAACAERLPSHAPEHLLVEPPSSRPFECAASDLFQLAGHHFLVYTDRFSGWPTVGTCGRTATSAQVISLLKEWMSEKGIQERLTTDGGPQFTSRACSEQKFWHRTKVLAQNKSSGTEQKFWHRTKVLAQNKSSVPAGEFVT